MLCVHGTAGLGLLLEARHIPSESDCDTFAPCQLCDSGTGAGTSALSYWSWFHWLALEMKADVARKNDQMLLAVLLLALAMPGRVESFCILLCYLNSAPTQC